MSELAQRGNPAMALRASQEHEQELEAGKQAEKDALNWPEYRDDKLGIAIRHPETSDGDSIVFFHAGNILFVRTTKSLLYARRAELPTENDPNILTKAKEIAASSSDSTDYDQAWEIRVFNANSVADLQKIVDDKFGPNRCIVGAKPNFLLSETISR